MKTASEPSQFEGGNAESTDQDAKFLIYFHHALFLEEDYAFAMKIENLFGCSDLDTKFLIYLHHVLFIEEDY